MMQVMYFLKELKFWNTRVRNLVQVWCLDCLLCHGLYSDSLSFHFGPSEPQGYLSSLPTLSLYWNLNCLKVSEHIRVINNVNVGLVLLLAVSIFLMLWGRQNRMIWWCTTSLMLCCWIYSSFISTGGFSSSTWLWDSLRIEENLEKIYDLVIHFLHHHIQLFIAYKLILIAKMLKSENTTISLFSYITFDICYNIGGVCLANL